MRFATIHQQGRRHVGRLSTDGQHLDLFDIDGRHGALPLVQAAAAGAALPAIQGRVALAAAVFDAPLPVPRRNLF